MKWEYTKIFLKVVCFIVGLLTFFICSMLAILCLLAGFSALHMGEVREFFKSEGVAFVAGLLACVEVDALICLCRRKGK